ncbi:MAG: glycosyltransferase family 2 protein [Acidobacteriota bacterium]
MKISAVIITYNEERNIEDAIRSVSWADEVLVVDSESTDRTRALAESLGAHVRINPWPGFSLQKQFAVDHAGNDWIFSLDADERVSAGLQTEIRGLLDNGLSADGYKIPRLSYYMGRAIKHGGWYPDLQLRLFNRRKGKWNGAVIHESVQMEPGAQIRTLRGDILHYSVESAEHHNRMIAERYAPLGAQRMYETGRRTSPLMAVFAAWFAFIRAYFLKAGFLDGFAGFCIAYFSAHHAFMKHLMLIKLQRKNTPKSR